MFVPWFFVLCFVQRAKSVINPQLGVDDVASDLVAGGAQWIESTPYNITAVYRPVVKFTEHANGLIRNNTPPRPHDPSANPTGALSPGSSPALEDELHSEGSQLRNFLRLFIETSFLPRVEADVNIRLDEVLNDSSAFDARELQRDARYSYHTQAAATAAHAAGGGGGGSSVSILRSFPGAELEHNLLLKCVLDLSDVLKKNFTDMYLLPHSIPDFLRIIEGSVARLLDKCADKFSRELVRHTEPAGSGSGSASTRAVAGTQVTPQQLLLQSDERVLAMIEADPLLLVLRVGERDAALTIVDLDDELAHYFSSANPIYTPLFLKHARIDRAALTFDTRIWSQMALMAESLEWMADRLYHLNVFSPEISRMFMEGDAHAPQQRGGKGIRRYEQKQLARGCSAFFHCVSRVAQMTHPFLSCCAMSF